MDQAQRPTPSGGDTGAELVPFHLEPALRQAIERRLAERVRAAWALGEIGGFRVAAWVRHDNRELILRQRIEALDDAELFDLWDGQLPVAERPPETVDVRAAIYTTRRIQLHVPGYLVGRG